MANPSRKAFDAFVFSAILYHQMSKLTGEDATKALVKCKEL